MAEPYVDLRNCIRRSYQLRGVPEESFDIMYSSLRPSTIGQYNCALKKWWRFCNQRNIDPFKGSTADVLACLSFEFYNNNAKHGSLNSLRSAIALVIGQDIGLDENVKRFFKGVQNLRPSRAKYDTIWNPKDVLDFIREKLSSNKDLSLEDLSMKTILLLALVTGHRMQTLSLIYLKNVIETKNSLVITITDPIKTSRTSKKLPQLIVPRFVDDERICPMSSLLAYKKATKSVRGKEDNLLVSFKKPHKAVGTSTLSRWVKILLGKSGIDISKFSSHSTRHASTSAANRQGVNIDVIRNTAGWSKESQVFARFYNLPLTEDPSSFANSVLKS